MIVFVEHGRKKVKGENERFTNIFSQKTRQQLDARNLNLIKKYNTIDEELTFFFSGSMGAKKTKKWWAHDGRRAH